MAMLPARRLVRRLFPGWGERRRNEERQTRLLEKLNERVELLRHEVKQVGERTKRLEDRVHHLDDSLKELDLRAKPIERMSHRLDLLRGKVNILIKTVDGTNRKIGGAGVMGRLRHIEIEAQSILRLMTIADSELPPPHDITVRRFRLLSQNEEDGMTFEILRRVGAVDRRFVEIGCGNNGGNSGFLALECGWSGLMVDGNAEKAEQARLQFRNVVVLSSWITRESVNQLLEEHGFAGEVDLLSIDIDGNDVWVWEAIEVCRPRVVIVEYNSSFGAERAVAVPYQADFNRHAFRPIYYGASLTALVNVGRRKGYRLVAAEPRGTNAYFVRDDLGPDMPECHVDDAFRLLDKYDAAAGTDEEDVYAIAEARGWPLVEVP